MRPRKWTDPPRLLPVFVILSAASTVTFWALGHCLPGFDWSLLYNVSLASFTGSVGARAALWVYSFLAEESQRSEWRHDQEMRHFESIYGPLYTDTMAMIASLKRYRIGGLAKWREVKEDAFGPFVDPGIAAALNGLESRLNEHSRLDSEAEAYVLDGTETALNMHFGAAAGGPLQKSLQDVILQDRDFLNVPDVSELTKPHFESLRAAYRQHGPLKTDELLNNILRAIKDVLQRDQAIRQRVAVCRALLPLAEEANALILHRMKDPFEKQ